VLPAIPLHSGDRNRTSPMAFTGNRFEFRAVGSSQSIAGPLVALNAIMAESLEYCADFLEKQDTSSKEKLGAAVTALVKEVYLECEKIVFNGDGYSDEWHQEAAKRGLPNLKTCADALPEIKSPQTIALFEKYGVLSERETLSRYEVYAEVYIKTLNTECRLMLEIAKTQIFPAAIRYQSELAVSLANLKQVGIETDSDTLTYLTKLIADLQGAIKEVEKLFGHPHGEPEETCQYYAQTLIPSMNKLRAVVDELETIVADDHWPLPTYQEMLFIK
jgi:glutamine synthetase